MERHAARKTDSHTQRSLCHLEIESLEWVPDAAAPLESKRCIKTSHATSHGAASSRHSNYSNRWCFYAFRLFLSVSFHCLVSVKKESTFLFVLNGWECLLYRAFRVLNVHVMTHREILMSFVQQDHDNCNS